MTPARAVRPRGRPWRRAGLPPGARGSRQGAVRGSGARDSARKDRSGPRIAPTSVTRSIWCFFACPPGREFPKVLGLGTKSSAGRPPREKSGPEGNPPPLKRRRSFLDFHCPPCPSRGGDIDIAQLGG
ncbi:MAG: hypothetical protein OJF58_005208 [Enhydrobacter sp.]|nr:MAG: hypothetical protein OJF58_005208 [Enhydrobacter sp.]